LPSSVDLEKETVITGRVVDGAGLTVGGAFVRLLDASDEFTAEVVASATGDFRFFAAPGTWSLRRRAQGSTKSTSRSPDLLPMSGAPASRGAADEPEPPVASLLPRN